MFQFLIDEDQVEKNSGISHSETNEIFSVGEKIKCDKHSGVVKYVGNVNPHSGIWLGVEWDDPVRGKHNGSVDGVEYFQSTQNNAASFVRPHKVKRAKDVFTALRERYGYDPEVMSRLKLMSETITPRQVCFEDLSILDLNGKEISEFGEPGELVKICPNVEFLNLSDNLITSWKAVTETCAMFKMLKSLDLSRNPLLPPDYETVKSLPTLNKLEHIVLGNVKYGWSNVLTASILWHHVTNLQIPFNLVDRIFPPTKSLLNLNKLDLEGNRISVWDEVIKLNVCQGLEYLNLCGNKLNNVRFPLNPNEEKNCQSTQLFTNLKQLNISQNLIDDWISITELNKLQSLDSLRIELNPVFENDTRETNRQMIIARIGKLNKLEGVDVNRQERRDAEIDYLKKFSAKWHTEGTELRFAIENPRYAELAIKHGASEKDEMTQKINTLQSSIITLQLIPESPDLKPCSRKVMPNMTVQKLKMLLQKIFKKSTPITYLGIISSQNSSIAFSLENELFDLSQYSIEDGDKVIIKWT